MAKKNETTILVLALLITAAILGGGLWLFGNQFGLEFSPSQTAHKGGRRKSHSDRISLGNKILIGADTTPQKKAGVEAFAAKDYVTAAEEFEKSLRDRRNDPETRIYLNNAKAASNNPLKLAVSVPIGGNLDIAKEILRGVAQAQNEANQAGGINGRPIEVAIANDDNSPLIAEELAQAFVRDSSILAVVGHNSSNASLAAAPEYERGKLAMISPTSDAKQLSAAGDYIFRTVPSIRFQADTLSRYAVKAGKTKIAVCADSQAEYSQSLKAEFTSAMLADGGRVTPTNCDLAASGFNADTAVSQAIADGAEGLLLVPGVNRLSLALEVALANQRRLPLFASSAMYTFRTLKDGQDAVRGTVLTAPWHPAAFEGNPFPQQAEQLWGGRVNWRTALAYDAMQAIIAGLQQGNASREGLQQALSRQGFATEGATGNIRFLPSGDRNGAALLIEIQPSNTPTGLDFSPL